MVLVLVGFLVVSLLGTLCHFIYDLTNHNKIAALFVAVNESVWEHIKIALTPTYLWFIVLLFINGEYPNFWLSSLISVVTIIFIIPLLFVSYQRITKRPLLSIDVTIFYIAIFLSQYFGYRVINLPEVPSILNNISIVSFFIIFGLYLLGTLIPIKKCPFFKDPITKKYGIEGHSKRHCKK